MASILVNEFTDNNFRAEVLSSDLPVIIDIWAEWCGPCRMLTPIIEEIASEFDGTIKVGKLNVDENPTTASTYDVQSIPTVLFVKKGVIQHKQIGLLTKDALKSKIQKHLLS